jgi:hypothetical protein
MDKMEISHELSRDMRRELRVKLKDELAKVQGLSSKLEARELQLRQPRMTSAHQGISDSQFSGNGLSMRGANVKEVTSQLHSTLNGIGHHSTLSGNQQPTPKANGTATGTKKALSKKHNPKSNEVYKKLDCENPMVAESQSAKKLSKGSGIYKKAKSAAGNGDLPLSQKPTSSSGSKSKQASGRNNKKTERGPLGLLKKNMSQCKSILKKLMGHEDGWIFNEPVDAAHLGLSDYHSVIKKPMDLGTVKDKLDKKKYKSLSEFADDVMLTFNNAMTYNPQGNDVHQSASVLLSTFEKDWDVLKKKWERGNSEKTDVVKRPTLNSCETDDSSRKTVLTNSNTLQEKATKVKGALGKPKATKAKASLNSEVLSKSKTLEGRGKPKKDAVKSESLLKSKSSAKPKTGRNAESQVKSEVLPKLKASEKVKRSEKIQGNNSRKSQCTSKGHDL